MTRPSTGYRNGIGGASIVPDLAAKVAFLTRPETYPQRPSHVDIAETHMSYVFLAGAFAYKLKKPVRQEQLDFTTLERRRYYCSEEVRLNRRLANDVYLGTIPVTREPDGSLALSGSGDTVEWVVHMRRLPAASMLDAMIVRGTVDPSDVDEAARRLADFYARAPALSIPPDILRERLAQGMDADLEALVRPEFGLNRQRVERVVREQHAFLVEHAALFDARVRSGRLVEGHGDLRPEHICVVSPCAIIDCLEFCEELRQVDPADELSFLGLECARLGQPQVGRWFLETYTRTTGDAPPAELLCFYRNYRALRRAKIAVRRLEDPTVRDPARFASKARRYLELTGG
jgi:aminoglycoside phosphotransferase family enzyme